VGQLAPQLLIRLSVEVLDRDPRRIGSGVLTQMFTDALPGCLLLPDALLDELPAVITGYYTWIAEQHLPKADRKEILRRHTAALPGQLGLSIPAAAVRPHSGVADSAPALIRGVSPCPTTSPSPIPPTSTGPGRRCSMR
jgi:hypothetical protein